MVLNSTIVEYDIKQANVSVMEHFGLVKKSVIDKLKSFPDKKRKVVAGLMQQKDKELAKALEAAFTDIMQEFIAVNGLDIDLDILEINKDACFVISKTPKHCQFGPVLFRPKNSYHSFLKVGAFEFFVSDTTVDVKGLSKYKDLHENGILMLIKDLVDTIISANSDTRIINNYLHELADAYKKKELDFEYYREFNSVSKFHMVIDGKDYTFDSINERDLDELDISYNYINVILPLIRLFL